MRFDWKKLKKYFTILKLIIHVHGKFFSEEKISGAGEVGQVGIEHVLFLPVLPPQSPLALQKLEQGMIFFREN